MTQSAIINTPLMRFVSGDLDKLRTEDHKKRPIAADKQAYEFGCAVAKDNPALPAMFQAICSHLWTECAAVPAILQKIQNLMQYFPLYVTSHSPQAMDGFSWKMSDGDKPNEKGEVSEHTKGHWVFYFKSRFPFSTGNAQNAEIPITAIKRGDYVDVAFTCAWNGLTGADEAGVYLNPKVVRLQFEGPAIGGGMVSVAEAFAAAPTPQYQAPVGAKLPGAMPAVAANPMAMPGGAPLPMAAQPVFPAPAVPQAAAPAAFPVGNAPAPIGLPSNVPPAFPPVPNFAGGPGFPGQ